MCKQFRKVLVFHVSRKGGPKCAMKKCVPSCVTRVFVSRGACVRVCVCVLFDDAELAASVLQGSIVS